MSGQLRLNSAIDGCCRRSRFIRQVSFISSQTRATIFIIPQNKAVFYFFHIQWLFYKFMNDCSYFTLDNFHFLIILQTSALSNCSQDYSCIILLFSRLSTNNNYFYISPPWKSNFFYRPRQQQFNFVMYNICYFLSSKNNCFFFYPWWMMHFSSPQTRSALYFSWGNGWFELSLDKDPFITVLSEKSCFVFQTDSDSHFIAPQIISVFSSYQKTAAYYFSTDNCCHLFLTKKQLITLNSSDTIVYLVSPDKRCSCNSSHATTVLFST